MRDGARRRGARRPTTDARMARAAAARFGADPVRMRRARADHGYATDARMGSPRRRGLRLTQHACGGAGRPRMARGCGMAPAVMNAPSVR
jgi:hypothetical protein